MDLKQQFVRQHLDALFARWLRKATGWGIVVFLALSGLDFIAAPELFRLFLMYRLLVSVVLLALLIASWKAGDGNRPMQYALGLAAVAVSAATIELMILRLGGPGSSYYVGHILLGVCVIGFIPAGMAFHAVVVAIIFATHLLPVALVRGQTDPAGLAVASGFMIAFFSTALLLRYLTGKGLVSELEATYDLERQQEALERQVRDRTQQLSDALGVLDESEKKFRTLFHQASDAIFLFEARDDGAVLIADANSAACRMHGYSLDELKGMPITMLDDRATAVQIPDRLQRLLAGDTVVFEGAHLRKDGTVFPVEISAVMIRIGGKRYIIGIDRDITDRKRLEEELQQRALYDSLTNLPNRVLFRDRLRTRFDHWQRHQDIPFGMLLINIDQFRRVNEVLGPAAGDLYLIHVAQRLAACIRPGDTVSRFGGDEFAVLLDEVRSPEDAAATARRLLSEIAKPFAVQDGEVNVSAGIGIALSATGHALPEDLLRGADTAMQHAKARGRGGFAVFDETMYRDVVQLRRREQDLRLAAARGELEVRYQPILNSESRGVYGFESLLRWRHPDLGLLLPESFIPLAEETGMIVEIGAWSLDRACRDLREWQRKYPVARRLYVSVNVSAKQLTEGLPDLVRRALAEHDIRPKQLKIEITESVIMANTDLAHAVLTELAAIGVEAYLDDFGTGYSSLNYLHKFPVKALKIDRSFVRNIKDRDAQEIVKAVTALGTKLGMGIIIEGVEEQSQLEQFRALQCYSIQGFLFARPLDLPQAERYIGLLSPQGAAG